MTAYYNEHDPFAAAWLRELIAAGHIAAGVVDERSIEDVVPTELAEYTQCHFFAGIGGWSHALRLGGWPDERPVWTGSCPCQPFSAAGKGEGFADERHLWPAFHHLIGQCRPAVVLGEQVASKATDDWFDLVQVDMEALGYAFGCVPFPAASVGAPEIRDRAYWVASSMCPGRTEWRAEPRKGQVARMRGIGGLEYSDMSSEYGRTSSWEQSVRDIGGISIPRIDMAAIAVKGFWRGADWVGCGDGYWRPVEPGTFPLAHGIPARMGRLRGYGNAIVPPQAKVFIEEVMEVIPCN